MIDNYLLQVLQEVKEGKTTPEDGLKRLRTWPYENLGFARLDHHRVLRQGRAEAIYTPGKTPQQVADIASSLWAKGVNVLATRAEPLVYQAVLSRLPQAQYHPLARLITVHQRDFSQGGQILVVSAGTADQGTAEEAALSAQELGHQVQRLYDVGVAGLHRLLDSLEMLQTAQVIIVAAGMEGALASVVAGLVASPVIAVPTSVGYGSSFGGLAALLAMLNSCAGGVGVVNIDNGFGAATLADAILGVAVRTQ